jgi:NAD(P)-dependent dehydrogenase (short-subunit alcohol dehydrogenase family)
MSASRRTAVVTGSSKGWGRAVAEGLAAAGVQVVVNGRSDDVDVVTAAIRERGGSAIGVRAAADTAEGVEELMTSALLAYGSVSIWVNSLGRMNPAPLLSEDEDSWLDTIRTQLTSVFLGSRAAARQMVTQGDGGRIINVAGGAAFGSPGASAHAATKGAVLAATYSWAEELRAHDITVNAIRGGVQSPGMNVFIQRMGLAGADVLSDEAALRDLGFYRREEAAPLAVWLASEAAADITGWYVGIDGSRIVVYGRVTTALELSESVGWSAESLQRQLHPALLDAAAQAFRVSQRRPGDGTEAAFDERHG